MGVLQKAYVFVKKHWSTDDDVFPDDLNRYEDGIEDLYSRATEQDKQINVLSVDRGYSRPKYTDRVSEPNTGIYSKWINSPDQHPRCDQFTFFRLVGQDPSFISTIGIQPAQNFMVFKGSDAQEWQEIATTTKTDISFPYASEFMDAGIHYVSRITKNSMGECTAYIAVKKKDGTNFEPGIFYTIGTPPVGFRPKYGALGISNPIGKHDVGISYTDIVSIGIQTPVSANILLGTIRWECEV